MGLAYYVTRPDVSQLRRVVVTLALCAAGVAAHFVWNSPLLEGLLGTDPGAIDWIVWAAAKGLPFLLLLVVLVRVAIGREQRWVRASLAEDVASGLVTPDELATLEDLGRRRAARKALGQRKGVTGERLLARLQHAQIALAVASTGAAPGRETRRDAARELIAGLRTQLDGLPDVGWGPRPG